MSTTDIRAMQFYTDIAHQPAFIHSRCNKWCSYGNSISLRHYTRLPFMMTKWQVSRS